MQSITEVTAYPEPDEFMGLGFLGQHHATPASITRSDIEAEMASRGYEIERHHAPPVPPIHHIPAPGVPITREQAIAIACDVAIEAYGVAHTTTHPYWCPTGVCQIPGGVWDTMLNYAVTLANGFYQGVYALPDWAYHTSFSGLGELGALGVTHAEMESELESRGFSIKSREEPHPPVVHHEPWDLTKAGAIGIACDVAIAAYSLPHGSRHPYRCGGSMSCQVDETTWEYVVDYGVKLADGYLTGNYRLPEWGFSQYIHHAYYQSGGRKHREYSGIGFGALDGWIQDNPWVITAIIGVLQAYGEYLTAKQVEKTIKETIPPDMLTQGDLPALIAAITKGMPPNQAGVISAGATSAVMEKTPEWLIPVLVGGGVLMVIMMLKK